MYNAISFSAKGDFKKTYKFLENVTDVFGYSIVDHYAKKGVDALRAATPKDTGRTANSWSYTIEKGSDYLKINWNNSATTDSGIPIVLLIQYGHGTRQGGYVTGKDFINPAIKPVFDEIVDALWKEVTSK